MQKLSSTNDRYMFLAFLLALAPLTGFADVGRGWKPGQVLDPGPPSKLDEQRVCPPRMQEDPTEMKAISSLASSVFIGRVTSVTSDAQKRTIHIDVTIAWKGITVGKRHTMVSETNRSLLVPGPEVVGKRFLLMASGDPLVWSSCTFAMDISDLKGRELAAKIRAWSKAVGIKAKFK